MKTNTAKRLETPTIDLAAVKARADAAGAYMQMFIAYNPDTEVFVLASNDPCSTPSGYSDEAALLTCIAAAALNDSKRDDEEDGTAAVN